VSPKDKARLRIDTLSGVPIYRQIIDWVKFRVAAGRFHPGEQLPTVRQLAVDLGVNANTVARAYMELERMGLVNTLQGKGTFIAELEISMDQVVRGLKLKAIVNEVLSKASDLGFKPEELLAEIQNRLSGAKEES